VITHEPTTHDLAIELLPWLVNGSLDAEEREAVQLHAASCIICRRELAELRVLHESIGTAAAEVRVPAPDMRRINARIDAQLENASRPRAWWSALRDVVRSPWHIAFAAQTIALLVFAVLWLRPQQTEPAFRTLTTVETLPAGHYLRVVLDPTTDAAGVSELLKTNGLTVAAGPSQRGVITLRFTDDASDDERDVAVSVLREDSRVLFAEPVDAGN